MSTNLEVTEVEQGTYDVQVVQDHVVTQHRLTVDEGHLEQAGADGVELVRELCALLLENEALTAVPSESTFDQLIDQYPYLWPQLQERLSLDGIDPVPVAPAPAVDHPTHT